MSVPIEARNFTFTPELLKGKEGAPSFTLRYGTRRDKHAYRAELAARGLTSYTTAQIRASMLDEIRRLSDNTAEVKERMVDTAKRFWDSQDAFQRMVDEWMKECTEIRVANPEAEIPPPPEDDFDAEEAAWIVGIMESVKGQSRVLGNMNKANVRREFISSEVALAVVLVKAEGFDLTRDVDGVVDVECLAALQEWLGAKAEELGIEEQDSDAAYTDLCNAAFLAFHIPKVAEKNFASPQQPSSPEDSSKLEAAAPDDTISTDSAKSTSKKTHSADTSMESENSANSPSAAETSGAESNGPTAEASSTSPVA